MNYKGEWVLSFIIPKYFLSETVIAEILLGFSKWRERKKRYYLDRMESYDGRWKPKGHEDRERYIISSLPHTVLVLGHIM